MSKSTNTKQQTAVDYLEDILFTLWENGDIALHGNAEMKKILEQARQMERDQIRVAYTVGLYDSSMKREERFDNGLDYYNQTYGKDTKK